MIKLKFCSFRILNLLIGPKTVQAFLQQIVTTFLFPQMFGPLAR